MPSYLVRVMGTSTQQASCVQSNPVGRLFIHISSLVQATQMILMYDESSRTEALMAWVGISSALTTFPSVRGCFRQGRHRHLPLILQIAISSAFTILRLARALRADTESEVGLWDTSCPHGCHPAMTFAVPEDFLCNKQNILSLRTLRKASSYNSEVGPGVLFVS